MSKQNTNTNMMKKGDFENLLCKANKQRDLHRANLEVKQNTLNKIKTNTPLFKDLCKELNIEVLR